MRYVEDVYSQCPFYSKESVNTIVCEGLYSGTSTRITFLNSKFAFKQRFCRNNYEKCRLYKCLMEKYND